LHNHYHLLLETPQGNLSQGIRQLNGTYTQHINKKYQRAGYLFQGRFKPTCLFPDWILSQFRPDKKSARISYQDFILSGINKESPFKQVKGQIFLGSEYFLTKMEQLTEIPRQQLYATRLSLEELFQTNSTKEIKIYQANQKYGYTLKEIGQYLGLHYTTVSKIIKKVENEEEN